MWNGAVEAISTLCGATVTLLASRLHANLINTNLKVLSALCTMSMCAGASIFLTANVSSRFVSYAGYLLFYVFYNFTITVSRYFHFHVALNWAKKNPLLTHSMHAIISSIQCGNCKGASRR